MFAEDLGESFAQSTAAFAQDLGVIAAPWRFDLAGIRAPLALWHGDEDHIVPASIAEAITRIVSHAELHRVPGAGHLLVIEHWRETLGWLMQQPIFRTEYLKSGTKYGIYPPSSCCDAEASFSQVPDFV